MYITNSDEEAINPKKLMTIWESGFKNKYGEETSINGEILQVIYLYPESPEMVDYHTVILYISESANELRKTVFKMKDNTAMTYLTTKFTLNPAIDDSKFIYYKENYPGYTEVSD